MRNTLQRYSYILCDKKISVGYAYGSISCPHRMLSSDNGSITCQCLRLRVRQYIMPAFVCHTSLMAVYHAKVSGFAYGSRSCPHYMQPYKTALNEACHLFCKSRPSDRITGIQFATSIAIAIFLSIFRVTFEVQVSCSSVFRYAKCLSKMGTRGRAYWPESGPPSCD